MIRMFLLNLFLAVIYAAVRADASVMSFLVGFGVGYVVLTLYGLATGTSNYGFKCVRLVRFGAYFLFILTKANLQIAWEIITPGFRQTPRIIRYPVAHLNNVEVTTLASCITLTPGTLVVDISDDNNWLYVHCMYAKDRQKAIADLDELANTLMREVFS